MSFVRLENTLNAITHIMLLEGGACKRRIQGITTEIETGTETVLKIYQTMMTED